ncbi:MAG: VanZ family protein [Gammaproteobacteria bacterium]|nr:VanZ family protein [Gammaproteobacteria bacterium]
MKGVDSPLKNDKLEHFIAFFGLAFLAHHAMRAGFAVQMFLLFGYGAWIELVQYFLPYRSSAMNDFFADIAGACCYHAFYQVYDWAVQNRLVPAIR